MELIASGCDSGCQLANATSVEAKSFTGLPGGNSEREPPDPIPNSEVKTFCADGSVAASHARVGHCQAPHAKAPMLVRASGPFSLCAPSAMVSAACIRTSALSFAISLTWRCSRLHRNGNFCRAMPVLWITRAHRRQWGVHFIAGPNSLCDDHGGHRLWDHCV